MDGCENGGGSPPGALSPSSTTALGWQPQWPLKPDIVLEGGNAAADSLSAVTMPSLSLLTTHHEPANRLFTTTNATSAATVLAARMAAQVMSTYPDLWPKTVRGLIVQSAEWTPATRCRCSRSRAHRRPHGLTTQAIRSCGTNWGTMHITY